MTRKRILHHYAHSAFDTGSPRALAAFIEVTDRERFDITFLANKAGPLTDHLEAHGVPVIVDPVHNLAVRHPIESARRVMGKVSLLRRLAPDLVHVTGFGWNEDLVAAAGLLRIPLILHVHLPEAAGFNNANRLSVDKVLFCSAFEVGNFGHPERIRGRAQVLYNVIKVDEFASATPDRARFGLAASDVVVTTVSQLSQRKGIDILVETAKILLAERRDLVFVHAGPTARDEPEFAEMIRQRVASEPQLEGRFRFLGSRKDIPVLMASSDVFVLPSRAEPFGLVVAEAMSTGVPVVVSAVGGIPEAVGSPDCGYLVRDVEPESFARSIREALALPDGGRAMGVRARESVRDRFHPDVIGRQLNDIYTSLTGR